MQLINISLILAASLASTVQARHAVEPHLHPRSYDNGTYPATSTVIVSPLPVTMPMGTGVTMPMGTGVTSVAESMTTKVSNTTLTYTMASGSSTTIITTTVMRTETLTFTETVYATRGDEDAVETDIDGSNKVASSTLATTDEPTTTVTDRSATTKTVTVESVGPSGGDALPAQATEYAGDDYGSPETPVAGGTGCAAVATVTETVKSTITVTASPSYSANMPPPVLAAEVPSTIEDAGSVSTISVLPILSTGSTAPFTNGTTSARSTTTKKKCNTSGFVTLSKPTTLPSGYKRS